jgi:hypothetical protein
LNGRQALDANANFETQCRGSTLILCSPECIRRHLRSQSSLCAFRSHHEDTSACMQEHLYIMYICVHGTRCALPRTDVYVHRDTDIRTRIPVLENSTEQYGTVQYSTVQYSTVQYSTVQYSTIQYNTVHYGTIRYGMLRYGTQRYATARRGKLRYGIVQSHRTVVQDSTTTNTSTSTSSTTSTDTSTGTSTSTSTSASTSPSTVQVQVQVQAPQHSTALRAVQYTVYSIQYNVYSIQYTVYSIQ